MFHMFAGRTDGEADTSASFACSLRAPCARLARALRVLARLVFPNTCRPAGHVSANGSSPAEASQREDNKSWPARGCQCEVNKSWSARGFQSVVFDKYLKVFEKYSAVSRCVCKNLARLDKFLARPCALLVSLRVFAHPCADFFLGDLFFHRI